MGKRKTVKKANSATIANDAQSEVGFTSESDSEPTREQTVGQMRRPTDYESDISTGSCLPLAPRDNLCHVERNAMPTTERENCNTSAALTINRQHDPSPDTHNIPSVSRPLTTHSSLRVDTQRCAGDTGTPGTTSRPASRSNTTAENLVFTPTIAQTFISSIVDLTQAVKNGNDMSQQNLRTMSQISRENSDLLRNELHGMAQQMSCMQNNISQILHKQVMPLADGRQLMNENYNGHNAVTSLASNNAQNNAENNELPLHDGRQPPHDHSNGRNAVTSLTPSNSQSNGGAITYLDVGTDRHVVTQHSQIPQATTHTDSRTTQLGARSFSHTSDGSTSFTRNSSTGRYTSSYATPQNPLGLDTEAEICTAHSSTAALPQHAHSTSLRNEDILDNRANKTPPNISNTKLPKFTGDGNSNWKVWYARFSTVATIHNWDENRRLSELVQHLDGSAADFVFDQISPDCRFDCRRLVQEMDSRFLSEETRKTYRMQFGRRTQRPRESIEDFAAELKRLYDRAYCRKDPEIRQQALVDRFLAGLHDTDLQFAVEWSKEPGTIEEAVRHVIHYMEARHGHDLGRKTEYQDMSRYSRNKRRVTFSDDSDSSDDDFSTRRCVSRSPISPNRQSIRQVANVSEKSTLNTKPTKLGENASQNLLKVMEQFLACHGLDQVASTDKDDKPRPSPGRDRLAITQCYFCRNFGHLRRDCPELVSGHEHRNNGINAAVPGSNFTSNNKQGFGGHRVRQPSASGLSLN
ncbi:MAG: hypothetical protein ABW185_11820 [Sedimenticola sp.]